MKQSIQGIVGRIRTRDINEHKAYMDMDLESLGSAFVSAESYEACCAETAQHLLERFAVLFVMGGLRCGLEMIETPFRARLVRTG